MIVLLSPSKTQDFTTPPIFKKHTVPYFEPHIQMLVRELQKFSPSGLAKLMSISKKIAELNTERYKNFKKTFNPRNAKQAILAFKGHVYIDMDVKNYSSKEFDFAQKHVRIFSGLYGLLRPLDLIQPYRLEFKIQLKNAKGKDLYEFWEQKITDFLQEDLKEQGDDIVINLASEEYFSALKPQALKGKIFTPIFKEKKGNHYKIIGLLAKRARGMMTDFMVKNKLSKPEDLKHFDRAGYKFRPKFSTDREFVFAR